MIACGDCTRFGSPSPHFRELRRIDVRRLGNAKLVIALRPCLRLWRRNLSAARRRKKMNLILIILILLLLFGGGGGYYYGGPVVGSGIGGVLLVVLIVYLLVGRR
jgi:hypothetical protein